MELLKKTLQEEEETDKKLSQIAQTVNLEATEAQPEAVSRSRSTVAKPGVPAKVVEALSPPACRSPDAGSRQGSFP
jgi:hypothetical protein